MPQALCVCILCTCVCVGGGGFRLTAFSFLSSGFVFTATCNQIGTPS